MNIATTLDVALWHYQLAVVGQYGSSHPCEPNRKIPTSTTLAVIRQPLWPLSTGEIYLSEIETDIADM